MSGGPVVSVGQDNVPCVRGIVRSDESRDPWAKDLAPAALVSLIWPLMLMPSKLPENDGTVTGKRLLDLQRAGIVVDRGNASDHIAWSEGADGQIVDASWRPPQTKP
jgi:hypothetical protein